MEKSLKMLSNFKDCLSSITIVQNGADYDIDTFLEHINLNNINLHCIVNEKNTGSAGGFGTGVEFIKSFISSSEYILILDDDSLIPIEVQNKLSNFDFSMLKEKYSSNVGISLYRPDHDQDSSKFERNWDYSESYYENTLNRFSILHKLKRDSDHVSRVDLKVSQVFMAPYSGLILSGAELDKAEEIQQNYFLYDDDSRFTAKLSMQGVNLLVFKDLYLEDLEKSWYQTDDSKIVQSKSNVQLMIEDLNNGNNVRAFYQIRNGVFTGKSIFMRNKIIFAINLILFCIMPIKYVGLSKRRFSNYLFFLRAVYNGMNNKLGKIEKYDDI